MTVLVTGARGFIGHHVSRHLSSLAHKVVGIGHGAWVEADHRRWGVSDWLNGEISHANLDAIAERHGVPEYVLHLAGGSAVGPSFAAPAEDFRRTVGGTADLAEWVRRHAPNAALVMASSAAVYGAGHADMISERSPCTPFSPYGFHKRMAEVCLESYARSFGLRVASVRLFSVYGLGLRKQLLWDTCTRLMTNPTQLVLGGSGDELRDWLHVEDAARLLALALDSAGDDFPVINSGTGIATPVRAIAEHLVACWGRDAHVTFSGVARPGDPQSLVACCDLARSLGWTPVHNWKAGLTEYVEWFRESARGVA